MIPQARSGAGQPLALAIDNLAFYLSRFGGANAVRVWGNGADFDNAILSEAARAAGLQF